MGLGDSLSENLFLQPISISSLKVEDRMRSFNKRFDCNGKASVKQDRTFDPYAVLAHNTWLFHKAADLIHVSKGTLTAILRSI